MTNFNFTDKKILVTGSSSGIGFHIAKGFIQNYGNVIINGRNNKKLNLSKKSLGAYDCIKSDISKDINRKFLVNYLIKKKIKLDVLVCNVGASSPPVKGLKNNNSWLRAIENNFLSTAHLISLMSEKLLNHNSSIICISSICSLKSLGCPITYACAKSALNTFVEQEATNLAKKGIRINAVLPGNIMFNGSVWQKKILENKIHVNKIIKQKVPMQRFGTPEEVANAVLFLASDLSSFTTGIKFTVDGGQSL